MCAAALLDALGGPGGDLGDLGDLGAGGRGYRVEGESTTRLVAHVHAVQGQDVETHIQSESTIRPCTAATAPVCAAATRPRVGRVYGADGSSTAPSLSDDE